MFIICKFTNGDRAVGDESAVPEERGSSEVKTEDATFPMHAIDVDLQEVSEKALNAAKEWGSQYNSTFSSF